ncbi:Primosomal protein N' [Candidatus Providencia siddallii]|uniref:Replication restart protein PriA n=1 Tax=Candidatus Providencia siddallii TaxID=1715285 RepID=A0A0M6W8G1_9GAMM|nr:Primosomal protein N' [Candidatus Providencia siddallii]
MFIIQVALQTPLNHTFDYLLPANINTPMIGSRVIVQFGKKKVGIVVDYNTKSKILKNKLKDIEQIIDTESVFTDDVWKLLLWSSQYYHYPIGKVLFFALPKLLRQGKKINSSKIQQWKVTKQGQNINLNELKDFPKQQKTLSLLRFKPIYHYQINDFNITQITLTELKKKKYIELLEIKLINNKLDFFLKKNNKKNILNNEQKTAIEIIKTNENKFSPWLLTGVTGSKKIEIYINILENILTQGKQALILTPEIGLAPQTVKCLQKHFNTTIDKLHSKINDIERLNIWLRSKLGQNTIIIGTRSALFTPFAKLGIIIIDEEHDDSYKQKNGWSYHARDLAIFRAKINNIPIIMGTTTPSFETLFNVQKKKYNQLNITINTNNSRVIFQHLIDLKKQHVKFGLSQLLIENLKKHLEQDNQVILFLNQRGYSQTLICYKCKWIPKCQRCNQFYTFHKQNHQILCHNCNSYKTIPQYCGICNSNHLTPIGLGTEQLEEGASKIFPNIPITRIDKDTTNNKNQFKQILSEINSKGARILIGTQMLSKCYDFPEVTLIALLNIDKILFSNDFRATERFSQFYIKMSDRAGRKKKQNEIFLQTHYPEHQLLLTLLKKGYNAFIRDAMEERRIAMLPPYSNHILIRSEDYNNKDAQDFLYNIKEQIIRQIIYNEKLLIFGPSPSIKTKQNGRFIWNLILQHKSKFYLQQIITQLLHNVLKQPKIHKIKWNIDVDPINI